LTSPTVFDLAKGKSLALALKAKSLALHPSPCSHHWLDLRREEKSEDMEKRIYWCGKEIEWKEKRERKEEERSRRAKGERRE